MFDVTLTPFQLAPTETWTVDKFNQGFAPTISVSGSIEQANNFNSIATLQRSFTVSDLTNDEITATAHGFTSPATVDAVLRVNVSSSGSLPGGLIATSTFQYFVRVKDANTLTLHTSAAGALANTDRVDITSNGSGVHALSYTKIATAAYYPFVYNSATAKWEIGMVTRMALPAMIGATASVPGASGAVPQPAAADFGKYLRSDGTWADAAADVRTAFDQNLYLATI